MPKKLLTFCTKLFIECRRSSYIYILEYTKVYTRIKPTNHKLLFLYIFRIEFVWICPDLDNGIKIDFGIILSPRDKSRLSRKRPGFILFKNSGKLFFKHVRKLGACRFINIVIFYSRDILKPFILKVLATCSPSICFLFPCISVKTWVRFSYLSLFMV